MATMRASRRVLSLTELVSLIFEFVAVGYLPGDDEVFYMPENPRRIASSISRATLWNCAQVNTLWFREAMRHLWSELSGSKFGALESMPLARRQIYMSFVTRLSLVCAPYSSQRNGLLKGLNFPRVRSVTIQFWEKLKLLYLPKIQAPALRVLDIRLAMIMPTDTHILFDDRVEKRFVERCKKMFPSLQRVVLSSSLTSINPATTVNAPAAVQSFAANFGDVQIVLDPITPSN